jgi:hypothetical protein
MKKSLLILFAFTCITTGNLFAQNNELAMARQVLNTEKRLLITEGMQLTDEQAKIFWPVYDEYELERSKLGNERVRLIERYAKYYDNLSDEMADKIMTDALTLRTNELKLTKKYYKIFKKNLDNKTAARFIQLEEYLNTVIRMQVSDQIPFVPTN